MAQMPLPADIANIGADFIPEAVTSLEKQGFIERVKALLGFLLPGATIPGPVH